MFNLDIPILAKLFNFYKELSLEIISFPKTKRYGLGQRIDLIGLDIIELVMTAGYQTREDKLTTLQKISTKLDLLKMLLRLSWEIKCLDNDEYNRLSAQLIEIGKMLGGWIKTVKQ